MNDKSRVLFHVWQVGFNFNEISDVNCVMVHILDGRSEIGALVKSGISNLAFLEGSCLDAEHPQVKIFFF